MIQNTRSTGGSPTSAPNEPDQKTAPEPTAGPVVSQKRKKRKYSRGLKEAQRFERGLSKATERIAKAVFRGMSTYRRRGDKSARRSRDGAIKDAIENFARAAERSLRTASRAPLDLVRSASRKTRRRQTRFLLYPFT